MHTTNMTGLLSPFCYITPMAPSLCTLSFLFLIATIHHNSLLHTLTCSRSLKQIMTYFHYDSFLTLTHSLSINTQDLSLVTLASLY